MENIYSVLITAVTVLSGTGAFRYYEKRAQKKEKDDEFIRHDCKDRISKLEALLVEAGKEKDSLRDMVLALTKEVAALSVKVEYLTKENEKLSKVGGKKILMPLDKLKRLWERSYEYLILMIHWFRQNQTYISHTKTVKNQH
jgi:hypothetical protein